MEADSVAREALETGEKSGDDGINRYIILLRTGTA
jgi:hypothetical protein